MSFFQHVEPSIPQNKNEQNLVSELEALTQKVLTIEKRLGNIEKRLENGTSKKDNDDGPITSITEAQLSDPDSDSGLPLGDY